MRTFNQLLFLFAIIAISSLSSARNYERRGYVNTIRVQPTIGEPWPKPQSIQTTPQRFAILPSTFHFLINETSQSCDLLTSAFDRYYTIIFFPQTYLSHILRSPPTPPTNYRMIKKNSSNLANASFLMDLSVYIEQPCDEWPSLESNESCKKIIKSCQMK